MGHVLFNTFIYLLLIFLGYLLKKLHVVPANAADTAAALVVNLTLPAMLLYSSDGITMSGTVLVYILIGIGFNIIMMGICLYAFRKQPSLQRSVMLLSGSGTDVGNFVLPFILTFFPGEGVFALTAFNIGNTIMIQGFDYVAASRVSASGTRFGVKDALKRLFSSVTFDVYLLIIFLAVTRLRLPGAVMQIIEKPANANICIVMLMIGFKLELKITPEERKNILNVILVRLAGGALIAAITCLLPITAIAKIAICAAYFGPPSSVSNVYAKKLGYQGSLTSQVNVLTIFTGMIIITALMMFTAV